MDSLESINAFTCKAYNLAAQKYHDLFHNEMNEKEYDRKLLDSFAARFNKDSHSKRPQIVYAQNSVGNI